MARVKYPEVQWHMDRWKIQNPGWTRQEYMKEYYRKRAEDPKFRKAKRDYQRTRRLDPKFYEAEKEAYRKRYAEDPEFRERVRIHSRERYRKVRSRDESRG